MYVLLLFILPFWVPDWVWRDELSRVCIKHSLSAKLYIKQLFVCVCIYVPTYNCWFTDLRDSVIVEKRVKGINWTLVLYSPLLYVCIAHRVMCPLRCCEPHTYWVLCVLVHWVLCVPYILGDCVFYLQFEVRIPINYVLIYFVYFVYMV